METLIWEIARPGSKWEHPKGTTRQNYIFLKHIQHLFTVPKKQQTSTTTATTMPSLILKCGNRYLEVKLLPK